MAVVSLSVVFFAFLSPQSSIAGNSDNQLQQRINRLETGVRAEEAIRAVKRLQHIYGYYLDRKLWDDVADLFAEDGSLEVAQRGVYAGKPHIRRALEVLYGASPLRRGELFDHLNLTTVVTIAPDSRNASARTSQLSMLGLVGEYSQWELGTYENEFIKQDGLWKIKAVHYYPRMAADYDKGWARIGAPARASAPPSRPQTTRDIPGGGIQQGLGGAVSPNRFVTEFPPDRPIRSKQYSFPEIVEPAFHYKNPVTGRMPAELLP